MERELNPPRQQRSQDTLDAISRATRKLLKSNSFRDLTIADIVREANSSAGSFYARFKGKQALLHYLHEEMAQAGVADLKAFIAESDEEPLTPAELARRFVPEMVRSHLENRGIIRATMVESLNDRLFATRGMKYLRSVAELLASQTMLTAKSKKQHTMNIERAMGAVLAILDQNLFHDKRLTRTVSDEEIARLVRIFQASLGV